jgi:hypothetical protein
MNVSRQIELAARSNEFKFTQADKYFSIWVLLFPSLWWWITVEPFSTQNKAQGRREGQKVKLNGLSLYFERAVIEG